MQELERIVGRIRQRWLQLDVVIRADSGFCRKQVMAWCGAYRVDYVLGLAKNERLNAAIAEALARSAAR